MTHVFREQQLPPPNYFLIWIDGYKQASFRTFDARTGKLQYDNECYIVFCISCLDERKDLIHSFECYFVWTFYCSTTFWL